MKTASEKGFALATVLIASVILLAVLVTGVSATVAVRSTLEDQRYTRLAELAGEAGTVYAKACIEQNNGLITWTNQKPLKPNTDCNGDVIAGTSAYVMEQDNTRTYFVVGEMNASNISAKGYVEVLRTSTGIAWRIWSSDVAAAASNTDNLPIGTSLDGYWTSAPAGYLLEDGAAVSRTTYADLFSVIGTTFGTGDGSTTFNLPDSRGRVAVNKSTDTEFDVLGEKNGEKTHTLTTAEMPSHNHTYSRTRIVASEPNIGSGSSYATSGTIDNWKTVQSTDNTGGGGAHNNIQPSIVVLRVIKY